ncbi:hypothetical protein [Lyticum sinuosum]|uniref:Smc superfamily protein n=1 Tax=Lyticum sinuosum TaxID=1332059 RepID=A0AAE4VKG4_9RICK|nr:hypothetical protein [Lyticum sinuosum]MDZ5760859.1 putative Smc superfamily protein [Lyticum sinuosum]
MNNKQIFVNKTKLNQNPSDKIPESSDEQSSINSPNPQQYLLNTPGKKDPKQSLLNTPEKKNQGEQKIQFSKKKPEQEIEENQPYQQIEFFENQLKQEIEEKQISPLVTACSDFAQNIQELDIKYNSYDNNDFTKEVDNFLNLIQEINKNKIDELSNDEIFAMKTVQWALFEKYNSIPNDKNKDFIINQGIKTQIQNAFKKIISSEGYRGLAFIGKTNSATEEGENANNLLNIINKVALLRQKPLTFRKEKLNDYDSKNIFPIFDPNDKKFFDIINNTKNFDILFTQKTKDFLEVQSKLKIVGQAFSINENKLLLPIPISYNSPGKLLENKNSINKTDFNNALNENYFPQFHNFIKVLNTYATNDGKANYDLKKDRLILNDTPEMHITILSTLLNRKDDLIGLMNLGTGGVLGSAFEAARALIRVAIQYSDYKNYVISHDNNNKMDSNLYNIIDVINIPFKKLYEEHQQKLNDINKEINEVKLAIKDFQKKLKLDVDEKNQKIGIIKNIFDHNNDHLTNYIENLLNNYGDSDLINNNHYTNLTTLKKAINEKYQQEEKNIEELYKVDLSQEIRLRKEINDLKDKLQAENNTNDQIKGLNNQTNKQIKTDNEIKLLDQKIKQETNDLNIIIKRRTELLNQEVNEKVNELNQNQEFKGLNTKIETLDKEIKTLNTRIETLNEKIKALNEKIKESKDGPKNNKDLIKRFSDLCNEYLESKVSLKEKEELRKKNMEEIDKKIESNILPSLYQKITYELSNTDKPYRRFNAIVQDIDDQDIDEDKIKTNQLSENSLKTLQETLLDLKKQKSAFLKKIDITSSIIQSNVKGIFQSLGNIQETFLKRAVTNRDLVEKQISNLNNEIIKSNNPGNQIG